MSYMWIRFSLLCAATILQSSSINGEVSLKCDDTVEVVAGENVTLNCSIIYMTGNNCEGQKYFWINSDGDIQCNSGLMKYICGWDKVMFVYLTISNVTKEENYSIVILTDCGFAKSSAIKVQVQLQPKNPHGEPSKPLLSLSRVITAILGIFVTVAVVGILYFLVGTNRGRQIISCTKKQRDDSEPGEENFLPS